MFDKKQVIKTQVIDVQVNWGKPNQKSLVVNIPNQSSDSHFGKVHVNAKIQCQQMAKQDPKKEKTRDIQTLKMQIESSVKKNKIFTVSLPISKAIKRPADSKIHFLLQITDKKALLTIADQYTDCRMSIKGKTSQVSVTEAVEIQKKKLDRRRKNSYDEQPPQQHNDPDMKGGDDDD